MTADQGYLLERVDVNHPNWSDEVERVTQEIEDLAEGPTDDGKFTRWPRHRGGPDGPIDAVEFYTRSERLRDAWAAKTRA